MVRNFLRRRNTFRRVFLNRKAFSLIELSAMLVVFSIIVAGMLSISTNRFTNDSYRKTQDNLKRVYHAMGAYLLKNGRLPCPAPITSIKDVDIEIDTNGNDIIYSHANGSVGICDDSPGVYADSDGNGFVYGMLPVRDLGIATYFAEDGFGSKLGYFVYQEATNEDTFGTADFSGKGIDVEYKGTSLLGSELAAFAIVSYGENKHGAFNTHMSTQNSASSDSAEKYNYLKTYDEDTGATFESGTTGNVLTLQSYSITSATDFDDFVFFKTRSDLVRDFNALFLVKCVGETSPDLYGVGGDIVWLDAEYGEASVSTTPCPSSYRNSVEYPARRCGAFGVWEDDSNGANIAVPCT